MSPLEMLSPELLRVIRENTFQTEQFRRLPEEVLDCLYQEGALRVMIPKQYDGMEWSLPKIVAYFEALAYADGNVGWLVNLGAGANMFAGYLEKDIAHSIFRDKKVWCAGSGAPTGKAMKTKSGFRLFGRWKYASGAAHATHFTVNAFLYDEKGEPITYNDHHQTLSFIFERKDVTIYDTWHTTGLCATNSQEFSVENLNLDKNQSFSLLQPSQQISAALYHFPFEILAVLNMAVMPIGMGLHFIELFYDLVNTKKPLHSPSTLKEDKQLKNIIDRAIPPFLTSRETMFELLDQVWQLSEEEADVPEEVWTRLVETAKITAEKARKMVYDLYPICGMDMAFSHSSLNKVWRDMSVASQHYLLYPY